MHTPSVFDAEIDKSLSFELSSINNQLNNSCADNGFISHHCEGPSSANSHAEKKQCIVCLYRWLDWKDQANHYKSAWHCYNLKRRLLKQPIVSEDCFEFDMVEEDIDSPSDSEDDITTSSDWQHTPNETDQLLDVLKQRKLDRSLLKYFTGSDGLIYGIYRSIALENSADENAKLWSNSIWIVILMSYERFAGGVFCNRDCQAHKVIHRYTVRRKQGGGQTSHDSGGVMSKSAGASLRRYNARALIDDVQSLLCNEWKQYITDASFIFLRCASYQRKAFFSSSDPVFSKSDGRINPIPLYTKKPTFDEVKRVFRQLTTVQCFGPKDEFMATLISDKEAEVAYKKSGTISPLKTSQPKTEMNRRTGQRQNDISEKGTKKNFKLSPLEDSNRPFFESDNNGIEHADNHTDKVDINCVTQEWRTKIYTAIKQGNRQILNETLNKYFDENNSDSAVAALKAYLNEPFANKQQTFLHSVLDNYSNVERHFVTALLVAGCDPCLKDSSGKVPFQCCPNKTARGEFIDFRQNHSELYDWNVAQVPKPVDPAIQAERNQKEAERKKAAKKVRKEKQKIKKEEEKAAAEEEAEKRRFLALSDREKRALAAERRILMEQEESSEVERRVLTRCFLCGVDISGKVPFEYNDNRFCSVQCVRKHRTAVS